MMSFVILFLRLALNCGKSTFQHLLVPLFVFSATQGLVPVPDTFPKGSIHQLNWDPRRKGSPLSTVHVCRPPGIDVSPCQCLGICGTALFEPPQHMANKDLWLNGDTIFVLICSELWQEVNVPPLHERSPTSVG